MDAPEAAWESCANCGARNRQGTILCFLCNRPFQPLRGEAEASPWTAPRAGSERDEPPAEAVVRGQFRLSSVMLLITVVAVCLGVLRETPGLGVLLSLIMVPVLVRTLSGIRRAQARGRRVSAWDRMELFIGSFAIVTVILISASIAFVTICFPAGFVAFGVQGPAVWVALAAAWIGGLVGAGFVTYWVGRRLWFRGER